MVFKGIRESILHMCEKLFVDEESTWHKSNRRRNENIDRIYNKNDTKRRIQQALCKN